MTNCKQCNKPLTGKRSKFCSDVCGVAYSQARIKQPVAYYDPLGEKLKQEYGNLRVYAR